MTIPYAGVWPVAPTPFADSGALDLEGQKRVLDCMIDQGVDGICILANYSERCCQSNANQSRKCARSGVSGCKLTPFGQRGRSVLLEDIAAV